MQLLYKDTAIPSGGTDGSSIVPRERLEPVLIALALIDPALVADMDHGHLSTGAATLLAAVEKYREVGRLNLFGLACSTGDEEAARLAERADRLTLGEITEFSPATVMALIQRCAAPAALRLSRARAPRPRERAWQAHLRRAIGGAA
jgi:hypothetical protein